VNKFDPGSGHLGIDFAVKEGSPVFAAEDGYVIFSDYTPKDGHILILQHADKYQTFYKHCSQLLKSDRQSVRKGEIIALSGNTGYNTTGSHLHFELWLDGKPVNPEEFIIK
jgi:murein DD-endopeptidase MepM/ murein hydrolase activator NlpD